MIQTDMDEVFKNLSQRINSVAEGDGYLDVMRVTATSMNGIIATRIFEKGKSGDGGKIGEYSTDPIYVNPKTSTRQFPTGGKNGATKKKNNAPYKTKFFAGGYNEYKTAIGRNQLGTVNLSLTGQMNNQLTVMPTEKGFGLGWANEDLYKRALHFEQKYQKQIFSLTSEEKETAIDITQNEVINAILE